MDNQWRRSRLTQFRSDEEPRWGLDPLRIELVEDRFEGLKGKKLVKEEKTVQRFRHLPVKVAAGQMLTSRDSVAMGIKAFWDNVGVNMREPKWIWDQMVIDVLSPNAAVMTARYHIPHLTPRNQPHTLGGAWTAVFEKRDGRWYIIQEHLSDLPAMPDSAMTMPMAMPPGMKMPSKK